MGNSHQHLLSPYQRRIWLTLLVAVTFFMENLDATVIATAIPEMAKDFAVTPITLNIGISSYLLSVAIFIPLSSWLVGRLGARLIFSGAIAIFTVSSVMCAISSDLTMFTISRILQGVGGALMVPVGRMIVLETTEKKEMVKTIAIISWPGLIAPILGPVTGGAIATYISWPWIFWLNVPIGIVAICSAIILVPKKNETSNAPFDSTGFLYTALFFLLSIFGLELMGNLYVATGILSLIGGIAAGVLAVKTSQKKSYPLLSLAPFYSSTFRATIVSGSFFRASINAVPFMLPLLFQLGFGWSAVEAGMMVLWVFAGNLAIKPFTTRIMFSWGFRKTMLVNGVLSLLAMLSCLLLSPGWSRYLIAFFLFLGGMTRSLQFSCYNSLGFADTDKSQMKDASVIFSIFFQFSMSAGISIAALLIKMSMIWTCASTTNAGNVYFAFVGMSILIVISLWGIYKLKPDSGSSVLEK